METNNDLNLRGTYKVHDHGETAPVGQRYVVLSDTGIRVEGIYCSDDLDVISRLYGGHRCTLGHCPWCEELMDMADVPEDECICDQCVTNGK